MNWRWWRKPERTRFLDALREEEEEREATQGRDTMTALKVTTDSLESAHIYVGCYLFWGFPHEGPPGSRVFGKVSSIVRGEEFSTVFVDKPWRWERLTPIESTT